MLHRIDPEKLGPHGEAMASAVSACVHCGFCLPTCPTYRELGQEMDTPRGRIILMKNVLEGDLDLEDALPHVDLCLGCLACEPACPSGVSYRSLISPFRAKAESERRRSFLEKTRRFLISTTVPHPARFRMAAVLGRLARPLRNCFPKPLRPMFDMLPERLPEKEKMKSRYPAAKAQPLARVALLAGCAQQVLDPRINRDTIDILINNGIEVVVPEDQGCCGALAWHVGDLKSARKLGVKNLEAFGKFFTNIDAIITTAAGCGSGLEEYELIFAGTEWESKAQELAAKVHDITTFLDQLDLKSPFSRGEKIVVAYHDACHLANAQGIREEPRNLLRSIPGVELVEIPDSQICCGSAGTYNLDQPEIAASLGRKKAQAILDTGATIVATGNIGCLVQLRYCLKELAGEKAPEILHTVTLLARAYRDGKLRRMELENESPGSLSGGFRCSRI